MENQYDITVIGGGPGGYVAAIKGAKMGGKVAIIEKDKLGGTCLNRGCIPTKVLVNSAHVFNTIKRAEEFGIEVKDPAVNVPALYNRKDAVVSRLRQGVEYLIKANKIRLFRGEGKITGENSVEILTDSGEQTEVRTRNIIIATGSEPAKIPVPGIELEGVITSDEALNLKSLPDSVVIIGGGVIGLEFASIFNSFGVKTAVVEMLPRILPQEDEEISRELYGIIKRDGVDIYVNSRVEKIEKGEKGLGVVFEEKGSVRRIEGERVLIAVGRKPVVCEMDGIDITLKGKFIDVNDRMRTNYKNIYAVGDAAGGPLLAHVAFAEGIVAAENCMGRDSKIDYKVVPRCIFTHPEVGAVGLTEEEARRRFRDIKIGKFPFSANGKALAMGENEGFVKIIADSEWNEVLGVHILGPNATELVAEGALAIKLESTAEEIAETIHAHPTLAEGIMECAHDILGAPLHKI